MRLFNMTGYKLFKEREDGSIHMVRIAKVQRPIKIDKNTPNPKELYIYDYDKEERRKVKLEALKDYTPIEPDGILTVAVAEVLDNDGIPRKDVIVTASKYLNIKFKLNVMPYAVCRQSITDIFNNMQATSFDKELVGLAVNQDTCPSNFDMGIMFASSNIYENDYINFYRTDTLEDLYPMMRLNIYDKTLDKLYREHCNSCGDPRAIMLHEHGGWCDNLKLLLKQNNFQTDIDQMLGITQVGFKITDFIEMKHNYERDLDYQVACDDFRYWLSYLYKINISEANIIEYDHDINLADFNDTSYFLIRDIDDVLYLIVYTVEGEYFEEDLQKKYEELDFSTKFKIDFYNKYNRSKS